MEGVTFLDAELQKEFGRFVEVRLHTDGGGDYAETSRRNREFQLDRFGTVALPYYVVLDPTGEKVYWEGGGVFDEEQMLEALRSAP